MATDTRNDRIWTRGLVWRAPVVVTKRLIHKNRQLKFSSFSATSANPLPPPGGAVWYSTARNQPDNLLGSLAPDAGAAARHARGRAEAARGRGGAAAWQAPSEWPTRATAGGA